MVTGPSSGVATALFLSTPLVLVVWQGTRECAQATTTLGPVATLTTSTSPPVGFSTEAFWSLGVLTFLAGAVLVRVGSCVIRLGQVVGLLAVGGGTGFAAGALAAGSKEPEQDEESDVSGLIELYSGDGGGTGGPPAGIAQDW